MFRSQVPKEQYVVVAARAVALSGNASEWERLWISASYDSLSGQDESAGGKYEALLRIYPDHFWGVNNLFGIYRRSGREADAVATVTRLVAFRPHDYNTLYLALDQTSRLGRLEQGAEFARRIRTGGVHNRFPSGDAWVFDAFLAWHRQDPGRTLQELSVARTDATTLAPELRDAIRRRTAMWHLALGRPADARDALSRVGPAAEAHLTQGAIAEAEGSRGAVTRSVIDAHAHELPAGESNRAQANQWAWAVWLEGMLSEAEPGFPMVERVRAVLRGR